MFESLTQARATEDGDGIELCVMGVRLGLSFVVSYACRQNKQMISLDICCDAGSHTCV